MISVRQLTKTLGTQQVLRGIDLEIATGETCVILGRSGCGKSVLLKHLIGLLQPTSGEVWIEGEEISHLPERQLGGIRKKVGMLFQSAALFDSMNVEENLAFPLREAGVKNEAEIRDRVAEALEMVDLAGEQEKMPEKLSGGMRKRVGLARTIVGRPECILYDEPTTMVDPIMSDHLGNLMLRLKRQLRLTSLVVTHDLDLMWKVADKVIFLHEGKVIYFGPVHLLEKCDHPHIKEFLAMDRVQI